MICNLKMMKLIKIKNSKPKDKTKNIQTAQILMMFSLKVFRIYLQKMDLYP